MTSVEQYATSLLCRIRDPFLKFSLSVLSKNYNEMLVIKEIVLDLGFYKVLLNIFSCSILIELIRVHIYVFFIILCCHYTNLCIKEDKNCE